MVSGENPMSYGPRRSLRPTGDRLPSVHSRRTRTWNISSSGLSSAWTRWSPWRARVTRPPT